MRNFLLFKKIRKERIKAVTKKYKCKKSEGKHFFEKKNKYANSAKKYIIILESVFYMHFLPLKRKK
jgi:hypothetical protein